MGIMGIGGGDGSLFWVCFVPRLGGGATGESAYWDGDIEGALTCLVSLLFYFVIVDFPEEAKFLTEEERAFVKARLQADVGESAREEKITLKDVLNVFKDCKLRFTVLGGLQSGRMN